MCCMRNLFPCRSFMYTLCFLALYFYGLSVHENVCVCGFMFSLWVFFSFCPPFVFSLSYFLLLFFQMSAICFLMRKSKNGCEFGQMWQIQEELRGTTIIIFYERIYFQLKLSNYSFVVYNAPCILKKGKKEEMSSSIIKNPSPCPHPSQFTVTPLLLSGLGFILLSHAIPWVTHLTVPGLFCLIACLQILPFFQPIIDICCCCILLCSN